MPFSLNVPVIVIGREAKAETMASLSAERWISHYEAGKWLAARLGTRIHNPNLRPNEHFVHGKLLFTDNFIQRVCETPDGLVHQPPQLLSMLLKSTPEEVRFIMVDPKMLELSIYDGIPHLLAPVVTDMKEAANALRWCVAEMERRYRLMASLGVRNIAGYNRKVREAI